MIPPNPAPGRAFLFWFLYYGTADSKIAVAIRPEK